MTMQTVILNDPILGEITRDEVLRLREGPQTMVISSAEVKAALDPVIKQLEKVFSNPKWRTQQVRYTKRVVHDARGISLVLTIHAVPGYVEMPTPEDESAAMPSMPSPPDWEKCEFARMAEKAYEHVVAWWFKGKNEPRGTLYALYHSSGRWISTPDDSHPKQSGFDWMAEQMKDFGEVIQPTAAPDGADIVGEEIHGNGCAVLKDDTIWVMAPDSDIFVFVLATKKGWLYAPSS